MSRRIRLLVAGALGAAATACPLHDLADVLERGAQAAGPHEWPYAAACAAFANTTEETWCGAGVRNSSGLGDGRSAESEELLSIDGSAPTSPV